MDAQSQVKARDRELEQVKQSLMTTETDKR